MYKSPFFALVSIFFVASVTSFPLNEPVSAGLLSDSELNQNLVDSEYFSDDFEDGSLSDDLGIENNQKIKNYVLGQPMPKPTTSGPCFQQCKSTTQPRCKNATQKDVKKYTMGELNYCVYECSVVNTNCFKRS